MKYKVTIQNRNFKYHDFMNFFIFFIGHPKSYLENIMNNSFPNSYEIT